MKTIVNILCRKNPTQAINNMTTAIFQLCVAQLVHAQAANAERVGLYKHFFHL